MPASLAPSGLGTPGSTGLEEPSLQVIDVLSGADAALSMRHLRGSLQSPGRQRASASGSTTPLRRQLSSAPPDSLPLYGRGNHAAPAEPPSLRSRAELAARASWLAIVFLPFVVAGTAAFVISRALDGLSAGGGGGTASSGDRGGKPSGQEASSSKDPAAYLRLFAYKLLLHGCKHSGTAFIKWGQWASTRQDLFPEELCEASPDRCIHWKGAPLPVMPAAGRAGAVRAARPGSGALVR